MISLSVIITEVFLPCCIYGKNRFLPELIPYRKIESAYVRGSYYAALKSVSHRRAVCIAYMCCIAIPPFLFLMSGKNLSSEERGAIVFASVDYEPELGAEYIDESIKRIVPYLKEHTDVSFIRTEAKRGSADIEIGCKRSADTARIREYAASCSRFIPDGFFHVPGGKKTPRKKFARLKIAAVGDESEMCRAYAEKAAAALAPLKQVDSVVLNFKKAEKEYVFVPDKTFLIKNGLTVESVASNLRWLMFGPVADKWLQDGREYDIRIAGKNLQKASLAQIENIQKFLKDFKAETIRLEQNYRSTANILNSANELIANNSDRLGKNLWTEGEKGDPVGIYAAFNELDEAKFVASQIQDWVEHGGKLDDCAILYRSNSQSRVIEEALIRCQIPYRIYGGMRFFERQEIKDALAYLRLINNRQDDAAFERVINTPTRGIGDRTLDILRNLTRERQITLWQAVQVATQENMLAGRASTALLRFQELINSLQLDTAEMPLFAQTDFVIKHSGLYEMYKQEKGEKGEVRIENLEELVTATREFIKPDDAEDMTELTAFLTHASLEAGEEQASPHQSCVEMMTLHSAKGLEFPRVFMVGVEEGLFPSFRSFEEPGRLEEERRLAYVGITRAKKKLTISYAESRRLYAKEERHLPSRFIAELPRECIQEIRLRGTVTRAMNLAKVGSLSNTSAGENEWKMGQKVKHEKFGFGTVINVEGSDNNTRLQIAFQAQGIKWLIAHLAKLEKVR